MENELMSQITRVLQMYHNGEYSTKDFCEVFETLYFFKSSGQRLYSGEQRIALDKLAHAVERFSANAEDIKTYPMFYSTEEQIRSVFDEIKGIIFRTGGRGDGSGCGDGSAVSLPQDTNESSS